MLIVQGTIFPLACGRGMRMPGRIHVAAGKPCGASAPGRAARSTYRPSLSAFFAGEKLHHEQDERHDDQQVNEEAGDVIDEETDDPHDHQQNGKSKDGSGSQEHLDAADGMSARRCGGKQI